MILNKFLIYNNHNRNVAIEFREKLRKRITYAEKMVAYHLKSLGYNFIFQQIVFHDVGKFFIVDFYIPELGIVVEVDGRHHLKKENRREDKIRTFKLTKSGIKSVVRILNIHCSWDQSTAKFINKQIIKALKTRQ